MSTGPLISSTAASTLAAALPPDNGTRVGLCTAIDQSAGTITVSVAGTAITCGVLSSYQPALNDPVAIIRERSSWLALGAVRAHSAVMMRNRVDRVTNATAGVGGATVLTMPSTTYPNGRVYRMRFVGLCFGSVSNQGLFQVFRNSTAGTLLFQARTPGLVAASANSLQFEATGFFLNTSGAAITDTLILQLTANAGTVTIAAAASFPCWFEVEDWADPTLYPNTIQL